MASKSYHPLHLIILFVYAVAISSSFLAVRSHEQNNGDEEMRSGGRRILLGFKETPKGSNVTFECSPSGPCVSCNSSEKRKEKYRCSETGYRIPFKCREVMRGEEASSHKKDVEETTQQNDQSNASNNDDEEVVDASSVKQRNLRDDTSPASKAKKSQSYKTYRSCVPSADEERVSVLGFEAVMLGLLLVSGSAVYYRKKQIIPMAGVSSGRSQSNSRF